MKLLTKQRQRSNCRALIRKGLQTLSYRGAGNNSAGGPGGVVYPRTDTVEPKPCPWHPAPRTNKTQRERKKKWEREKFPRGMLVLHSSLILPFLILIVVASCCISAVASHSVSLHVALAYRVAALVVSPFACLCVVDV